MIDKPSEQEEEYFVRLEYDKKKEKEHKRHLMLAEEEKEKLKELHFMRCPKCGMELIEIDYHQIKLISALSVRGYGLMQESLRLLQTSKRAPLTSSSVCFGNSARV